MLRALVNGLWATSPGFFPSSCPCCRGSALRAVWEASFPSDQPCVGQVCAPLCRLSTCRHNREKNTDLEGATTALFIAFFNILSGGCRPLTVHPFPNNSALSRALAVKIKLVSQLLFYGFLKDLSLLQILYKIPFQLWFISSPFLPQYFRSGLNIPSLTSLHTFYIVLDRLHFIAGVLFLKAVDCDTIAKRKTFVKVPLVMHSYHPLKRFNWK